LNYGFVLFSNSLYFQWFPYAILKLKPHEHQNPSLLIIENLKNNYSPNDRFLIEFFIKIISLDSSQRVPPMSPCPPLMITRVCPLLINPHVPNVFFFGFAHSFPMSPIAFSQCFQSMEFYENLVGFYRFQAIFNFFGSEGVY